MRHSDVPEQTGTVIRHILGLQYRHDTEGEQEYMRLLAAAYDTPEKQEFYAFIKSLDAVKASLTATAGEQGTNKEKTIVLGPDSDLARILSGAGLVGNAAND